MRAWLVLVSLLVVSSSLRGQDHDQGAIIAQIIRMASDFQSDSVQVAGCSLLRNGIAVSGPALAEHSARLLISKRADSSCSDWDLISLAPRGVWLLESVYRGIRDWGRPVETWYRVEALLRQGARQQIIRYTLRAPDSLSGYAWRLLSREVERTTYIDADSIRRVQHNK